MRPRFRWSSGLTMVDICGRLMDMSDQENRIHVGSRVSFVWPDGQLPRHGVVRDVLPFNGHMRYGVQPDGHVHTWDVWDYAPYDIALETAHASAQY